MIPTERWTTYNIETGDQLEMRLAILAGSMVIGRAETPTQHQTYETFAITANPDGSRILRTISYSPALSLGTSLLPPAGPGATAVFSKPISSLTPNQVYTAFVPGARGEISPWLPKCSEGGFGPRLLPFGCRRSPTLAKL